MKQFLSLSIVLLTLLLPGTAAADGWVRDTINGVVYSIYYTGERSSAVGIDANVGAQEDLILSGSVSIQSTATGTLYWYERDGYGNDVLRSKSISAPVTRISGYGFANSNITDIYIPEPIISIGDCAFKGCNSLTHITMPESITSIGYNAFEGCNGLTHITIPGSVRYICAQDFLNCENLTTVTWNARNCGEPWQRHLYDPYNDGLWGGSPIKRIIIGEEVESIGNHVFDTGEWCYGIFNENGYGGVEQIISKAITPPTIDALTFSYYGNCRSLSVPVQSLQAYKNAPYWKDIFFNIRAIGDANDDGNVNIDDVTELIDIMLSMNTPENNYADVDGDGRVSIDDVTELIDMMLKGN